MRRALGLALLVLAACAAPRTADAPARVAEPVPVAAVRPATPLALQPGEGITYSCGTSVSGTFGRHSGSVRCAVASSTPVPTRTPTTVPTATSTPLAGPGTPVTFTFGAKTSP